MAAYSLPVPAQFSSAGSTFSRCSAVRSIGSPNQSRRTAGQTHNQQRSEKSSKPQTPELSDLDLIWSNLIESLQQGVIVVSRHLKPIYWNSKAKDLCRDLTGSQKQTLPELPTVVSESCHRMLKSHCSDRTPLVVECQVFETQTIRISTRWLFLNSMPELTSARGGVTSDASAQFSQDQGYASPYILVFLENCNEVLRTELRIEQKKYDLTEREAEVWMLLRQDYTYQEIARMLQISLNTVKTHVKNVYAKKRSCQGQERFWCSE